MTDNQLLESIAANIQFIKEDLAELNSDVSQMKKELKNLEHKVISIELTLENRINPDIKIIAEGHSDLTRKLEEALMQSQEDELTLARLSSLEDDVTRIKEMIS